MASGHQLCGREQGIIFASQAIVHRLLSLVLCGIVLVTGLFPATARAQTHVEIIQGHVTSDSGTALSSAQIIVTRAPDRAVFRTSTDARGRYRILVAVGTSDYLVHVSMFGDPTWSVFRKRITRDSSRDSVFTLDVVLERRLPQQLSAVHVVATRPTPTRAQPIIGEMEIGGSEQYAVGVQAMLTPAQRGDINAMVLTLPGVSAVEGGFSVLGLPPDQNRTTLNGMAFSGVRIPTNARTFASVTSSSFDPSRGGFGGAEVAVDIMPGEMFSTASASLSLDAPALQTGGTHGTTQGEEYSNVRAGWGQSGMVLDDRVAVNFAVEGERQSAHRLTWASADDGIVQRLGLAPDSVTRLMGILSQQGVHVSALEGSGKILSHDVSLITRINTPWFDPKTFTEKSQSVGLIVSGTHSQTSGLPSAPVTVATGNATTESSTLNLQGMYTGFLTPGFLQDVKLAVNLNSNKTNPQLMLPQGEVLIASSLADGTSGLTGLTFGSAASASRSRSRTVELQTESKFFPARSLVHEMKINGDLRYDAVSQLLPANQQGQFVFQSIEDLAFGRPASFTRTLSTPERVAGEWSGFASVGDHWRVNSQLQLLYGLRGEFNRYGHVPQFNPAVFRSFGAATNVAPNRTHVSPRLGFTWRYSHAREFPGYGTNALGTFPDRLTGVLRGGIGEFRAAMPASLLAQPYVYTGLPGAAQRVMCLAESAPVPDWKAYASDPSSFPQECRSSGSALSDLAPMVQLVDRNFDAPRSWRANLSWTTKLPGSLTMILGGTYSLNLNQPSWEDLNFLNVPHFELVNEGRPVFVEPSAIIGTTGLVSRTVARRDTSFGRVMSLKSDVSGRSAQLTGALTRSWGARWFGSLTYTLQSVRTRQRGFDVSTFGSPTELSWARADGDVRHGLVFQAGRGGRYVNATLFGRIASGSPYSPLVAGDVNGDGNAFNDRAFVFTPAQLTDATFAHNLSALIENAPSQGRDCLTRQLGHPAARNSCEGPWTATLNAELGLNSRLLPARLRGWHVSLYLSNPLAGLDQLLHGSNARGWGFSSTPDPVLMQLVGFDSGARTMRYAVNPRFGNARSGTAFLRSPFRVTLSVSMDLSIPVPQQELKRFLMPGRAGHKGKKLTADELKVRYSRNLIDPYQEILNLSDSLLLQRGQAEALQEAQLRFAVRMDSAWSSLANEFAALPDNFDAASTLAHQEAVVDAIYDIARHEVQRVLPKVLTTVQLRMLPPLTKYYLESDGPVRRHPTRY